MSALLDDIEDRLAAINREIARMNGQPAPADASVERYDGPPAIHASVERYDGGSDAAAQCRAKLDAARERHAQWARDAWRGKQ